jgi:RHS repeat-associated protein
VETFAFDPAGNLLDDKATEIRRPLDLTPPRSKLVDNLLREYAGTHYDYDERGNQIQRWHNGQRSDLRWDLFDRLVHFEDPRLSVDFAYDALGRRLHKNSRAHYKQRPEAGSLWNRNEHARKQRELGCGFTLYGWDGDNLAWESSPAQSDGEAGRTVHYVFEPGTFVPVAQAVRHAPIDLIGLPDYSGEYSLDEDPVWNHKATALPFDALAWYQCDHLGTPQELTDSQGNMAWTAQYKAWGQVTEQRSEWARQHGVKNPIRFQGQYHDHETGLHYNRHRYYDPGVGRFISKDPVSYVGGLNLYAYAPNPLSWLDPLGLTKSPNGAGRKPKSDKPNQNSKCPCRKKWEVNRYDRVCEGNVAGVGYAKYHHDTKTDTWWSEDKTGHGESAWKVYDQKGVWIADADTYGDYMSKHKSETGKNINFKSLKCKDAK